MIPECIVTYTVINQAYYCNCFMHVLSSESPFQVPCRNKREGRHLASQELLALLHPEAKTWADILLLYGPGSKPDKRSDSDAILDAQTQRSNSGSHQRTNNNGSPVSVKTSLIRLLKTKMMELADQWVRLFESQFVPFHYT